MSWPYNATSSVLYRRLVSGRHLYSCIACVHKVCVLCLLSLCYTLYGLRYNSCYCLPFCKMAIRHATRNIHARHASLIHTYIKCMQTMHMIVWHITMYACIIHAHIYFSVLQVFTHVLGLGLTHAQKPKHRNKSFVITSLPTKTGVCAHANYAHDYLLHNYVCALLMQISTSPCIWVSRMF